MMRETSLALRKKYDGNEVVGQAEPAANSWIVVNVLSSVGLVFCNKQLLSDQRVRNMLFTFVSYQLACRVLASSLWTGCSGKPRRRTTQGAATMFFLCIGLCANSILTNLSLAHASVVVNQIFCTILVPSIAAMLHSAIFREGIAQSSVISIIAVWIGAFLIMFNDRYDIGGSGSSTTGLLLSICASGVGAIYSIFNVAEEELYDGSYPAMSFVAIFCVSILFDVPPQTLGQIKSLPWTHLLLSGFLVSVTSISQFRTGQNPMENLGLSKASLVIVMKWLSSGMDGILPTAGFMMILSGYTGSMRQKDTNGYRQEFSLRYLVAAALYLGALLVPLIAIELIYTEPASSSLTPSHKLSDHCYRDPRAHITSHYTAKQAAEEIFRTCKAVKPSDCKFVPNVVHLVFIGGNMKFIHYAAVKSMREVLKPDDIFVHGYDNANPNAYFKRAIEDFNLTLIETRLPSYVFDRKVDSVEHRTDVLRIETLISYGGFYFDMDVFVLEPMAKLRKYEAVMGAKTPVNFWKANHLANNILMSKRCSEFMLKWYDNYRSFDDSYWTGHSNYLPGRLFFENARNLHVEALISTNYEESFDFYEVPVIRKDWGGIFCVHLCIRGHEEPTEQNYRGFMNQFGNLIRHVMDGDPLSFEGSYCRNEALAAPFYIVDPTSGYALDVAESSCDDGTRISAFYFHGGANQQFRYHPDVGIISALCNKTFGIRESESSDEVQLQLTSATGERIRRLEVGSFGEIVDGECDKAAFMVNNKVAFRENDGNSIHQLIATFSPHFGIFNPKTGKTLDVSEGSCQEGTDIILWEFHGESNQIFLFDGSGNVVNQKCGLVLDSVAMRCDDGTALQLSNPTGDNEQGFELLPDGSLRSKRCNKVVEISHNQQIVLRQWSGKENQHWRLRFAVSA